MVTFFTYLHVEKKDRQNHKHHRHTMHNFKFDWRKVKDERRCVDVNAEGKDQAVTRSGREKMWLKGTGRGIGEMLEEGEGTPSTRSSGW